MYYKMGNEIKAKLTSRKAQFLPRLQGRSLWNSSPFHSPSLTCLVNRILPVEIESNGALNIPNINFCMTTRCSMRTSVEDEQLL